MSPSSSPAGTSLREPPETVPASRHERAERTARLVAALVECGSEAERAEVRRRLVLVNRGVAEAVANRYRGRGLSPDDLRQVAYLGLVRAVERFDPARGHDLLSFAVPTIRGEITRYFRDHGWMVRPPRSLTELRHRAGRVSEELSQELGRQPSNADLAEALDAGVEEVAEALDCHGALHPTSLDQTLPGDDGSHGASRAEVLVAGGDPGSDDALQARLQLAPVVRALDERDQHILYLRFFQEESQEAIGERLGVSQASISRALTRICRDLRDAMAED